MNKKIVLAKLTTLLDDIPRLKTLPLKNQEYNIWDQKVRENIKNTFGNASPEYIRYKGDFNLKYAHTDEEKNQAYIDFLNQRETALKSIIEELKKSTFQKIWNEFKDFIASIIAKIITERTK